MRAPAWTDDQLALLEELYPDHPARVVAAKIGRSPTSVYQMANKLGIQKSEAFQQSDLSGRVQRGRQDPRLRANQFKPGLTPWNKGVKGSTGTHPNSVRTQFKKGSKTGAAQHNWVPIGTERITRDGYLERKVTDDPNIQPQRRWVGVHRLVWEAENGKVPAGHVVCFLPGRKTTDSKKITLDAVELVSRGELAKRNHPRARDPELGRLIQLKGAITRQVNRIAREAKERANHEQ